MSIAAYKQNIREVEAPRDIERRVLSRITSDIERHAENFDAAETSLARLNILANGLAIALAENQQFWMALKHDLAEQDNLLPPDLRASLISLALWVERQSNAIMSGEAKVAPLVSINRSVADGLRGVPSVAAVEGA
ncbi:MAG: flagellar biosynthesis regulator FlaF [Pseudomonadota bacterium]